MKKRTTLEQRVALSSLSMGDCDKIIAALTEYDKVDKERVRYRRALRQARNEIEKVLELV